jgi:ABC-type transport system involved in multi-copper enzyme maturation permease subunit
VFSSVRAELLLIRKRTSSWILLGLWLVLVLAFGYVLPYATYKGNPEGSQRLEPLLPQNLIGNGVEGYPFFGGAVVLILGILTFGSDYIWGTLKTLLTQAPSRTRILFARLIALFLVLAVFVGVSFLGSAIGSIVISAIEGASVDAPSLWLVARGLGAAWLILSVWAAFGACLAILSKGTALAIGIGVLYALVLEGLVSAFTEQVSQMSSLAQWFLRANAYSLVRPLGLDPEAVRQNGPGAFRGPYVDALQALLVLCVYLACFLILAGLVMRRRDIP